MPVADSSKLTPKKRAFVEEYLRNGRNAAAAYRHAYDTSASATTMAEEGHKLLKDQSVAAVIAEADALAAAATAAVIEEYVLDARAVMRRWCQIATANPNDLVQHRRAPCRYCHGVAHAYQWKTRREFQEAVTEAIAKGKPAPTDEGGYGYSVTAPINPDCLECSGLGVGYTHVVDTREVSPAALVLYAGTKQTKDGLEIKMQDQAKALENVGKHLGMFVDRSQMLGRDGQPVDPGGSVFMIDLGDGRGAQTAADIAAKSNTNK